MQPSVTNQTQNRKKKKTLFCSDALLEPSACLEEVKKETKKKARRSHLTAYCDVTETTGLAKRIQRQIIAVEKDHVGLLNY